MAMCVLLSLAVATHGLQHGTNTDWPSFPIFGSKKDTTNSKPASTEVLAADKGNQGREVGSVMESGGTPPEAVNESDDIEEYANMKPLGDPNLPRLLVAEGCDGAATVLKHAHFILAAHGIRTPVGNMNQALEEHFTDAATDRIGKGLAKMSKAYQKDGETLLIKGQIGQDDDVFSSRSFFALGTKVVQVARRNMMDQVVCMVKDCFADCMGYPVMRGVKSDLCLQRRQDSSKDYKAFVNVSALERNIFDIQEKRRNVSHTLTKTGYQPALVNVEDLLDFEWSEDMIYTSVAAWKKLLQAWGVRANKQRLFEYLKSKAGSRAAPSSHEDTIFNFDAVKDAVKENAGLKSMLRESEEEGDF